MSLKFRKDGAVFPTRVTNGNLEIFIGSEIVEIPFKFLKEDFPYNNIEFPMCNIMCYLENDNTIIVMRYNGSVTIYNKDLVIRAFTKFDIIDIYKYTEYSSVGCLGVFNNFGNVMAQYQCSIYKVKDCNKDEYILEVIGEPEAVIFTSADNPNYIQDLTNGNRYFPRIKKLGDNLYGDDTDTYIIKGTPVKTTGLKLL